MFSCRTFEWRHKFLFFYVAALFNDGPIRYYILISNTLGPRNNYPVLLPTLLFGVYNLLIMKAILCASRNR